MAFKVSFFLDTNEAEELENAIKQSNLSDYLKDVYCATIQEGLRNRNNRIEMCREKIQTIASQLNPSLIDKDNMLAVIDLESEIELLKEVLT